MLPPGYCSVVFHCDSALKSLTIGKMESRDRAPQGAWQPACIQNCGKTPGTSRDQMSKRGSSLFRLFVLVSVAFALTTLAGAANVNARSLTKSKSQRLAESQRARHRMSRLAKSRVTPAARRTASRRRHRYYE